MGSLIDHRALFKKNLLLCFDAFGTLFTPKSPIPQQYGEVARRHGLYGFTEDQLETAFRKAFKEESKERPNYGKAVGMAAPEWWGNIIKKTFQPFLKDTPIPPGLIPDLIDRFSHQEGYRIYPDVLAFFEKLRKIKKDSNQDPSSWPWQRTTVGIITNSDDRVPPILESLGLRVGQRYQPELGFREFRPKSDLDIDFVVLSYDAGVEKPSPSIFEAARIAAQAFEEFEDQKDLMAIYVGDELKKDVVGATDAGWEAVLLDRDGKYEGSERGIPTRLQRKSGQSSLEASITVARDIDIIGPRLKAIWQDPKQTFSLEV
ncbi:hypothetical protein EV356DRAFT_514230 [Viridothelium virens]|uniref:HAD-like protein n=1 Tax=Viridothelium virens TaxID=1048519 RepID=A0A6A6HBC8_VIRVR|nr:hypothetical protein EV356DRAFT_514230 [Viridothelium virens]